MTRYGAWKRIDDETLVREQPPPWVVTDDEPVDEGMLTSRASEAWRIGRHSRGAGLSERLEAEYRGDAD